MGQDPLSDEGRSFQDVRDAGRAYVRAAWAALLEERVLPVPPWRRFLSVGSDYFGFLDQENYDRFDAALTSKFQRLSPDRPLGEREFASMFIHSVLQVCVARAAEFGDSAVLPDQVLDEAIDELIAALERDGEEVFCARTVSHIGTEDGAPLTIGGVTVTPVMAEPAGFRRALAAVYRGIAFGAGQFVVNEDLMTFDDPVAVVSATGTYDLSPLRDGYAEDVKQFETRFVTRSV